MCHIKDCAARAGTDRAEDTSRKTRQLQKAGRHQLTHQFSCRKPWTLSHCRTGWLSRRTYCNCQGGSHTVASARDPGAMCHLGLFLLHAVIAKGGTSPLALTCSKSVLSIHVVGDDRGRYGPLCYLRPAGRDVEQHASLKTCGFLSSQPG